MDWKDGNVEGVSGREATGNRGSRRLIPNGVRLIGGNREFGRESSGGGDRGSVRLSGEVR